MKKIFAAMLALSLFCAGAEALAAPSPSPASTVSPKEAAAPAETVSPSSAPTVKPAESAKPGSDETEKTVSPSPAVPPSPSPTQKATAAELSKQFKLTINIIPRKYIISSNAVMELYDSKGKLLGSQLSYVGWGVDSIDMTFDVPEYRMGEAFTVKLVSGLRSVKYYDSVIPEGGTFEVKTYGCLGENGEYIQNNGCAVDGEPDYEKELCMYVSGNLLEDMEPHARIVDGVAMMPVRAIGEAMGLKVKYDPSYGSVVCSVGSDEVIFNENSAYMTVFGNDTYASHDVIYIDNSLFVPVRALAEAFESSLETFDFGDHLDIVIGESPIVRKFRNRTPVNKYGISSRTNYLVWVSKSEYRVRVYEGSQYHWEEIASFPCALGAWDTPTITGQFEYIERTQWDYGTYYVGPVLRFHNGYALHSTLLYYGGGEYDGRVGVNISHGCVRLHPQDINWIADTIPFRTRIYITE